MKDKKRKLWNRRLSREILILFLFSMVSAVVTYFMFCSTAGTLMWNYCEAKGIVLDPLQEIQTDYLIEGGSLVSAVLIFLCLFLFLLGRKLAYLKVILDGIEALRIHHMDYAIPVTGDNEFTDLAKSINELSRAQRELSEKEEQMKQERELLIRALSHDIRTPLTSIRSYSEIMAGKAEETELTPKEIRDYIDLMMRKADQMKELTDQLLENSKHRPEPIEDGKLLMEQLVWEWEELIEEQFECSIDLTNCPSFSGEIDVREFQRIFDNLASNILKYADESACVELSISEADGRLCIVQKNKKKKDTAYVESHQIGLLSMKAIAGNYGGSVEVENEDEMFRIRIKLLKV